MNEATSAKSDAIDASFGVMNEVNDEGRIRFAAPALPRGATWKSGGVKRAAGGRPTFGTTIRRDNATFSAQLTASLVRDDQPGKIIWRHCGAGSLRQLSSKRLVVGSAARFTLDPFNPFVVHLR